MIRRKTKAVATAMLVGSMRGSLSGMVLTMFLGMVPATMPSGPGPSAITPAAIPEQMVAPAVGPDWPVLENPDQEDVMVAGRRAPAMWVG